MDKINTYGLNERDIHTISGILSKYSDIRNVLIFGSRAKDMHHYGSDIDLAIMDENINYQTLRNIKSDMSDTSLPYNVDLINFSTITNQELKEHILRVGKPLFPIS